MAQLVLTTPVAVALDFPDAERVRSVAAAVAAHSGVFKVGLTTIYGSGPDLVAELARVKPVFLDAKLHDIPAQVEGAVEALAGRGASLVTVHAAGGFDMVKAAVAAAGENLTVLAVTVLTSLDDAELEKLGFGDPSEGAVLRLAERALDAGAPGLVCSPLEVAALRRRFGARSEGGPLLVVPGVRPAGVDAADQRRTLTPRAALEAGADLLVVGRPITAEADPVEAARALEESLR